MISVIGETAGKVYQVLESKGAMTVTKLKTETKADVFQLNAALGWLAREDKVNIEKAAKSIKVSLK